MLEIQHHIAICEGGWGVKWEVGDKGMGSVCWSYGAGIEGGAVAVSYGVALAWEGPKGLLC